MPEEETTSSSTSPDHEPAGNAKPKKSGSARKKKPQQQARKGVNATAKEFSPDLSIKAEKKQGVPPSPSRTAQKARRLSQKIKPFDDQARNVKDISTLKGKRPIVALTAYDCVMGRLVCDAGVDFILVGDSVGTTLLGHKTTIPVDMTDMVRHTAAVRRSQPNCLLVADLPFGEASFSFDRLLESARRLMQEGGADAVKIEGGRDVADDVEKLVATGVPVLGHIGLLPQTVKAIGGYRKFGEERQEAEDLYTDAIALEEAGCFAVIAEMMEENVAREISRQILPPLVGIGSGAGCDGQILVSADLLGYNLGKTPPFVKTYANLNQVISQALAQYVNEVRAGKFPS
ncbi:MAG: 3-methyl-2-oxobutanoate hydroxymethyltransferase [Opitutae bacterium]